MIADKGYDADAFVEYIQSQQAEAIIPPRSNRKHPRHYDRHRYQARNLIERCFNLTLPLESVSHSRAHALACRS